MAGLVCSHEPYLDNFLCGQGEETFFFFLINTRLFSSVSKYTFATVAQDFTLI